MKSTLLLLGAALSVILFAAGCMAQANRLPEPRAVSSQSVDNGARLIASYGCGSCHAIPGIPGANAVLAPPLDRFYERSYIAGQFPNTWENLTAWIQNPEQMKPGTAMPNLGVKPDQAADIAAFLYRQALLGHSSR